MNMNPININQLQPFESLQLPKHLTGNVGINRYDKKHCQISATNDWQAIQCWLNEFYDSPQTLRNYRKEAERLLLWSINQRQKALSDLGREDFQFYQEFLVDPQPSNIWCGPRAERTSPRWRPFKGPLSDNSQRQALIIINALFSYLVDAGYLAGNPLSLIRRRNRKLRPQADQAISQQRYLDHKTWELLKRHLTTQPRETPKQENHFQRNRFLFHLLYLMAPRVSEVSSHNMNSFRLYRGQWWWFVLGKGEKQGKIPASDEMLSALVQYREHLNLTSLPEENDTSPLLRSISGGKGISANMVYRQVKSVVKAAAEDIRLENPIQATILEKASTHWFRHTSVTHGDDAGIDLKYLTRSARHEKIETTAIYQHAEDDQWHKAWQKLKF
ncbi:MAG TPA: integrase [Oceanospirillales bacterium]|nr:integrase [Oceanospirillales bacterium]